MTLGELIGLYRPHLLDESVAMQRSWEDTFKYTLRLRSKDTPLEDFDLVLLRADMVSNGINPQFADGYVSRWRNLITWADTLRNT
jgi:hypothetical protein